jgi:hypothetical protein
MTHAKKMPPAKGANQQVKNLESSIAESLILCNPKPSQPRRIPGLDHCFVDGEWSQTEHWRVLWAFLLFLDADFYKKQKNRGEPQKPRTEHVASFLLSQPAKEGGAY